MRSTSLGVLSRSVPSRAAPRPHFPSPSLGLKASRRAAPPGLIVDAVQFASGANLSNADSSRLARGAALTGVADTHRGILSAWVDPNAATLTDCNMLYGAPTIGSVTRSLAWSCQSNDANHTHKLQLWNAAGVSMAQFQYFNEPSPLIPGGPVWVRSAGFAHFAAAWDLARGYCELFFQGRPEVFIPFNVVRTLVANPDPVGYSAALDWGVNAAIDGINQLSGYGLAELYFAPGDFLDLRQADNMRRLITPTGKPANLGKNGELVTGRQPAIYMHLDDGETTNNFQANKGYAGAFTLTLNGQTYATSSVSPSD